MCTFYRSINTHTITDFSLLIEVAILFINEFSDTWEGNICEGFIVDISYNLLISDAEINIKISSCLGFVCWFLKRKVLINFLCLLFLHTYNYINLKQKRGKRIKQNQRKYKQLLYILELKWSICHWKSNQYISLVTICVKNSFQLLKYAAFLCIM